MQGKTNLSWGPTLTLAVGVALIAAALVFGGYGWVNYSEESAALDADIEAIRTEIADVQRQEGRYAGGLILVYLTARREVLSHTLSMLEQKRYSLLRSIKLRYSVDGIAIDVATPGELADLEQSIIEAEARAERAKLEAEKYSGGLLMALALQVEATARFNVARLRSAYYAKKYGLPAILSVNNDSATASASTANTDVRASSLDDEEAFGRISQGSTTSTEGSLIAPTSTLPAGDGPLGLSWGASRSMIESMGVTLETENGSNFGQSYSASNLPRSIANTAAVVLSFGYTNQLWRMVVISNAYSNDPYGTSTKARFAELKELLTEQYGEGESSHHLGRSIYSDPEYFLAGIRGGDSWYYTDFNTSELFVQVGLRATSSDEGFIVLIFEHKELRKQFDVTKGDREKEALGAGD